MKNIQNELTTSTIDEDLLPFFDENLSFDDNDSTIGSWLSLEHFPDDTRVQLTKRGRRFIFQSSNKNNSFIELIGRANGTNIDQIQKFRSPWRQLKHF